MEVIRTYYAVYRDGRLVKRGLGRDDLISGLYNSWRKGVTKVIPFTFNNGSGMYFDDIDVPSLVEAVNREGVLKVEVSYSTQEV